MSANVSESVLNLASLPHALYIHVLESNSRNLVKTGPDF